MGVGVPVYNRPMVICFRGQHPVFRPNEEPQTVTIDALVATPVFYSGPSEKATLKLGETSEVPELVTVHKGDALNRYSLAPGAWAVGPWRVEVFRNGSKKPWCVSVKYVQPVATVILPDYQPPEPPKPPLRVV